MKTIALEGKEIQISNESFEVLKASLVKENHERERVKNEEYFVIDANSNIFYNKEEKTPIDERRFEMGNYYHTREEARKARDRQLAVVRLWDAFRKDYYFEPDWSDENYKYSIIYIFKINYFDWLINTDCKTHTELPHFKSEEDVESFMKENEDDLRIVFGVQK